MIKLSKQNLHSANKGILFQLETLFVLLILFIFIIASTNINLTKDSTKLINYYKCQDIFTISIAKQLSQNEIKDLANWYIPNAEIVFDNSETVKNECYSKTLNIWNCYPVSKKTIFLKICI